MTERRFILLLLAATALATLVLAVGFRGRSQPPSGPLDPAIEHYTEQHGADYAGIDRWAYAGMTREMVAAPLQQAGYTCSVAPGRPTSAGPEEMVCTRKLRWPLARELVITATVEGEPQRRLVAARAASVLAGRSALVQRFARLLRGAGWMEPETLAVRGFDIADPDLLARFVADGLRGGWGEHCADARSPMACAQAARTRRANGFPAVDGGVNVSDAVGVVRALTALRLRPAVPPYLLARPADTLAVRVAGEEIWLDFAGRDLAGHEWQVAVQLAFEGGRPGTLVTTVDGKTKTVPLGGQPRRRNSEALEYLVPQRGPDKYRLASWLSVPGRDDRFLFERISDVLPRADAVFGARMMKLLLDRVASTDNPDAALGLYPLLLTAERRADTLRAVNAREWLPESQGLQLVRAAYRDDAGQRAAWALAVCNPQPEAAGPGTTCWQRAMLLDPELPGLLRTDLALLADVYATLPPDHPLQLRLQRWRRLLSP